MSKLAIFLLTAACILTACTPAPSGSADTSDSSAIAATTAPVRAVMTRGAQKALTPDQVLADLEAGNRRFVEGRLTPRDYLSQASSTAADGQFPKAIILGCLDSRVPPELVFDQGIGDLFVGRVAGNFENVDMLGSLEFGAKVAGSKLIVVLGHTKCGALKGAADGVELGNMTAMLDNFDQALAEARETTTGSYDSSNDAYVLAAIEENVRNTIDDIVAGSPILAEMIEDGELKVVGGVYELSTGAVRWLEP
jgi:carbonic anhydrase